MVTAAFPSGTMVEDLIFLPDANSPWRGLLAAALREGGFDIYDMDGTRVIEATGPRLTTITADPDFQLRGQSFPLILGVDVDGAVRAQALLRDSGDLVELGLGDPALGRDAAAICGSTIGIGYIDIVVLARGADARIWRIQDVGEDLLGASLLREITLPFPARSCASIGTDLVIAGPTGGIVRLDETGRVAADLPGISVADMFAGELLGRAVIIAPSATAARLLVLDAQTLEPIAELGFEAGLSAPTIERPTAVTMTDQNFGGMGFSTGIMAVFDSSDGRVKLVARDVVSRAVISPDS